jgi:hypothetical protein
VDRGSGHTHQQLNEESVDEGSISGDIIDQVTISGVPQQPAPNENHFDED